jgi:hypothetical protein
LFFNADFVPEGNIDPELPASSEVRTEEELEELALLFAPLLPAAVE